MWSNALPARSRRRHTRKETTRLCRGCSTKCILYPYIIMSVCNFTTGCTICLWHVSTTFRWECLFKPFLLYSISVALHLLFFTRGNVTFVVVLIVFVVQFGCIASAMIKPKTRGWCVGGGGRISKEINTTNAAMSRISSQNI